MLSVEQHVKRYLDGGTSSSAKLKYIESVNAVTESPMEKAAAAEDVYMKRVEESVKSGKYARRLRETPLSAWKDGAAKKGADRLGTGMAQSAEKVRKHFTKWNPIYEQASKAAAQIKKGGKREALQKVEAALDVLMRGAGRTDV